MKPIFLIGFMGSGKTTWGKKLAKKMDLPFVDLDHVFVEEYKMDIPSYFKLHGEEQFRIAEQQILKKQANTDAVISTGGGTPCFFDNMDWIVENGISVYLFHTPQSLYARLNTPKIVERPALKNLSNEELLAFIEEKLEERSEHYERAHIKIDQIHTSLEEIEERIQNHLTEKTT
ncbi:shikimate kinase [Sphingobacterium hungaricum]